MLITTTYELAICSDADGGIRLRPTGPLDLTECQHLNDAIVAALRSEVPRLEVDVRAASCADDQLERVLRAANALAQHLHTEFRVTGLACDTGGGLPI